MKWRTFKSRSRALRESMVQYIRGQAKHIGETKIVRKKFFWLPTVVGDHAYWLTRKDVEYEYNIFFDNKKMSQEYIDSLDTNHLYYSCRYMYDKWQPVRIVVEDTKQ